MINVYQPTLGKEELDALEKVFESNLANHIKSSKELSMADATGTVFSSII